MADTRLYEDLAEWWPLLSDPAEYAEEAAFFWAALKNASSGPLQTLLELGSGGGNTASHLKRDLLLTLADVSPGMIAVSRALNPDCEHHVGDMRTFRIGRTFDAVMIHDAIMYMTTQDDLARAIESCVVHCRPGGVVLLVPDCLSETFRPETDHGGHDGADGRALRYLDWSWDPDPTDHTFVTDYAYVLRDAHGRVSVAHDRHTQGLFPRALWRDLLRAAGLTPRILHDPWGRDVFVCVRRA